MIPPFFVHCQSFYSKLKSIYLHCWEDQLKSYLLENAVFSLSDLTLYHKIPYDRYLLYQKKIILALKLFAEQTGLSPIWLKIMHQYCVRCILILSADSINTVRFSILNLNIVQVFARQAG